MTRKLSRQELIDVTERLMTGKVANDEESTCLATLFMDNILHPAGTDLIFYPKIRFKTAEELVDYALAYGTPRH